MRRHDRPEPLYRKVNTTAHGVRHRRGGDARDERAAAGRPSGPEDDDQGARGTMHGRTRRGLDYTPLFRFLLSKVGQPFAAVHSEAVARLDRAEPIAWMVAGPGQPRRATVMMGESSYWSGLYVDDGGLLQRVDPSLDAGAMVPSCACCTHTFNGVRFGRPFPGHGD